MKPLLILSITPLLWLPNGAEAQCYQADASSGDIRFSFQIERSEFKGHFKQFELTYCWQESPEDGQIDVLIDMTSARTGNSDLDIGMQEKEGLAIDQYPVARWQTDTISRDDQRYQAQGTLTIRDISHQESGYFQLTDKDNGWFLSGHAQLERLDYDIGTGEYADTSFIPNAVEIEFEFDLKPGD